MTINRKIATATIVSIFIGCMVGVWISIPHFSAAADPPPTAPPLDAPTAKPQWEMNPPDCNIMFEDRWAYDACWAAATGEDWRCGYMSDRNLYFCRALADSARRARTAEREVKELRREVQEIREQQKK